MNQIMKTWLRSNFALWTVNISACMAIMYGYLASGLMETNILCAEKKALGHVIQGYLRVVEASGVWIRRVSVLRWSHFDICWCSASLLQWLARIWDLTSSYTITWGGKKRQILSFYKYKELPWQMIYSVCEWMIAHLSVNLSSAWSLEPSQPARRLKVQVQVISGLLSLDSKLSHSI